MEGGGDQRLDVRILVIDNGIEVVRWQVDVPVSCSDGGLFPR